MRGARDPGVPILAATFVFLTIALGVVIFAPSTRKVTVVPLTRPVATATTHAPRHGTHPRKHVPRPLIARTPVRSPRAAHPRRDHPPTGVRAQLLRVAACESHQHWHDDTGNGEYGGLQFDVGTWLANGGGRYAPRADLASEAQQLDVAVVLVARRGFEPWPICGRLA